MFKKEPSSKKNTTEITLEQINTSHEIALCLTENRIRLTIPDQSLSLFAPSVFHNSLFLLKWNQSLSFKKNRLFELLPMLLSSLLPSLSISEQQGFLKQLHRLLSLFPNEISSTLCSALKKVIQEYCTYRKEVLFLLVHLPVEDILSLIPFLKEEYHKSCLNQQCVFMEGCIQCCLHLREELKYHPDYLSKLQCLESFIESCIMLSCIESVSLPIESLFCEYLLLQMNQTSHYYYIPHLLLIQLLLLSNSSIVINAICLFIKLYCIQNVWNDV